MKYHIHTLCVFKSLTLPTNAKDSKDSITDKTMCTHSRDTQRHTAKQTEQHKIQNQNKMVIEISFLFEQICIETSLYNEFC